MSQSRKLVAALRWRRATAWFAAVASRDRWRMTHHMPGAVLVKDLPFLWVGACGDLPSRPSFELSEVLVSSRQAAGGDQDAS